jgi:protein-tyrosine phosphatase
VIDDSNWPLLIHCSAGKDRTGVAVTLILEALGVDDETIMQEFLLTNKIIGAEAKAIRIAGQKANKSISTGSRINGSRTPSAEAYFPLIGVSPEMLEAFYDGVDENYGSMDAYLAELGLDENSRRKLADSLTK